MTMTDPLADMLTLLEKACGRTALRRFLPPEPGDMPVTYADISRAKAEIGYDPRTPIGEGVERFVEWYRRQETGGDGQGRRGP